MTLAISALKLDDLLFFNDGNVNIHTTHEMIMYCTCTSRESTVKKRENIIDCIIFKRNACFPLHLTKMRKVYFNYWTRRQKIIDLITVLKLST